MLDDRLIIHTDEATTRSIEPSSYVTETQSDSPANFALARSWLAVCRMEHGDCRDLLEVELPTRLLDVVDWTTQRLATVGVPITLQRQLRTNLQSQLQGFPENQLPQTFYDAVRTTREFGLRYLWIDSLCIVQDDRNDFETECAHMNTVYTNALCTIAASDARDSRDGLFQSRKMKPDRLTYESDGLEPKLTVTIQPAFFGSWMGGLQNPLQSRAWLLQERHLSPRIIHYMKKCLMWECRTAIASEYQKKMRLKTDANKGIGLESSSHRFLDEGRSKVGSFESVYGFKKLRDH
ncbi:hypothetical protein EAF00_003255 [Botryotinia globosa]|nr:hypothetical protein EAF00_003255 [Botryotinia globosa]